MPDAWELLQSKSSGTGDAWDLLTNITGGGGGTAETYLATKHVSFKINPVQRQFTIIPAQRTFDVKPVQYAFMITTYVNGVPTR